MVKKQELSHEERLTVKLLRKNGHSFPQIAKVVVCYYSTCTKIFTSFTFHQKQRTGRPKQLPKEEKDLCAVVRGHHDLAD